MAQDPDFYYSQEIADNVASQYLSSIAPDKDSEINIELRETASRSLREIYTDIFRRQEHKEGYWWKEQFLESANILSEKIKSEFKETTSKTTEVKISYGSQIYERQKDVILIGRFKGCDVPISSYNDRKVSRLHAIVFIFRKFSKILVVDVGSFSGIKMLERSSETPVVHSLPDNRNVLVLELNEFVKLEMGSVTLIINPKDCVVCHSNDKNVRFGISKINGKMYGCDHYVVCDKCSQKLIQCPACENDIIERKIEIKV